MAYNRTMDLVTAALIQHRNGEHEKAAVLFDRAAAHESAESAMTILNAFNAKQVQAKVAPVTAVKAAKADPSAKAAKEVASRLRQTAAAWPFSVTATAGQVGEELHVEVEDQDMREVQEADMATDFDDMGLGLDDMDDDALLTAAADEDDEDKEDEDEEEDDEGEKEDDKKEESSTARFARTLRNITASRELAAKKAGKKPFGGKQAPPFKKKTAKK